MVLKQIVALGLLAALVACGSVAFSAETPSRPAVLFAGTDPFDVRTWDDWLEAGFEVDAREIGKIRTAADLEKFAVVVVNFLPDIRAGKPVEEQLVFEKLIAGYLARGGGVMVFCGGGAFSLMSPALNHFLEPYGAVVPEEQVVDREHLYRRVRGMTIRTTTCIEKTPFTAGISMLGYLGEASRADCMKLMMPVVIKDPAWKIIARGEKSAYSAAAKEPGLSARVKDTPDSYAESPVLAAWRTVNKGTLLLFPHNVAQTVTSGEYFENLLWDRDDLKKNIPQNRSFIMQAARVCARTAAAAGLGGFTTDRAFRPAEKAILKPGPVDWERQSGGQPPISGARRGLIGAQSAFSGGGHSIAVLSAAARAVGMEFLGFTEDLELVDEPAWERIKTECRVVSDDKFLALPGFAARDQEGNSYFMLGDAPHPARTKGALTAEGKRIDRTYNLWAAAYSTRFVGYADVGRNPNPWYEMKQVSGLGVLTAEAGTVVDNALDSYYRSCFDQENYLPCAYGTVRTPDELQRAAGGMVNMFSGRTLKDLDDYVNGKGNFKGQMFWENPHPWALSGGVRLESIDGINLGSFAGDEERENLFRLRFRLAGLQAGDVVLLRNGPAVFRKFIATGESFSFVRTWPHEQQRHFIIEVVRAGIPVFLSSPVMTCFGSRWTQCGDRQNTLPFFYQKDEKGDQYVSGTPIYAHYRSWPPTVNLKGSYKVWLAGAIGIEATPVDLVGWRTAPVIPFDAPRPESGGNLSSQNRQVMTGVATYIVDDNCNRVYPGKAVFGDCLPAKRTEALQYFDSTARMYALSGLIGQVNAQLVEYTIKSLADISLKNGQELITVSTGGYPVKDFDDTPFVETCSGGSVTRISSASGPSSRSGLAMTAGDYIAFYPRGIPRGGCQFAVAGNLYGAYTLNSASVSAELKLKVPGTWKKGDEFRYAILFTTGGSLPYREASDYQKLAAFLGFRGPYPSIVKIAGGVLRPAPVIATIDVTPEGVVRLETRKGEDDPTGLLVRFAGFSANQHPVYRLNGSTRWRFMSYCDGFHYCKLDTKLADYAVVAGQPVLSDRPEVVIALNDPQGKQSVFEVYNPTDKPVTVKLRNNPAFFREWTATVTLPAYESTDVTITAAAVQ